MNSRLDEMLSRVAGEVFESLAFVLPAFEDEPSAPPERETRTAASISFAGPFEGTLVLSASTEMLPALSANMLGLDSDEAPSQGAQRDAFKELLNVICGNFLPVLAGEQAVFDVHAAELLADGTVPATLGDRPPLAAARLHLDGGWADLALFAPEAVAAGAETASKSPSPPRKKGTRQAWSGS